MSFLSNRERLTRSATVEAARTDENPHLAVTWAVIAYAGRVARFLARWSWWLRTELAALLLPVAAGLLVSKGLSQLHAPSLLATVVAFIAFGVVAFFYGRRFFERRGLVQERRRRERLTWAVRAQWPHVMRANALAVTTLRNELLPRLKKVQPVAGGVVCTVELPRSMAPSEFIAKEEKIGSDYHCVRAIIEPGENLKRLRVSLYWADPLEAPLDATPSTEEVAADITTPADVGIYEDGAATFLEIYQRHTLIGGAAGSGKSVFLQLLLLRCAVALNTRLFLLDAKGGVELGFWEQVAVASGGRFVTTQQEGITLLDEVLELMRARLAAMREQKIRKHVPTPQEPQIVVVIDELAAFTQGLVKKDAQEFNQRLYQLVAQGRAAGISVIAATQKPTIETVGAARDLFHYRVAFACPTPSMSDVILGEGQASLGADASTIPQGYGGVGFILAEGDKIARRFRAAYLSDEQLEDAATGCAAIRLEFQASLPARPSIVREVEDDA